MGATPIAATTRYFAPEIVKILFVPTITSKSAPTREQLDGGKDLTAEISAIDGWTVSSDMIDAPDYGSRFTSQTSGRLKADNSSLTFYASQDTDDIRAILTRDTTGFVVIMWGGDVEGQLCDVFPIIVSSVGKSLPDNADADIQVMFAITSPPAEDVAIPAAA